MYEKGPKTASVEDAPHSSAQHKPLRNLFLFWPYIKKYPGHVTLLFSAIIVASFSVLIFGRALGILINHGVEKNDPSFLAQGILLLFGLVGCLALGSYLRLKSITFLGENVVSELKKDIFNRLLHQPYPFFERHKTGDLLSRLTSDVLLIQLLVSNSLPIALRNFILMGGSIILLFITSAKLAAYVFILAPLLVLFISVLGKKVKSRSKAVQENLAHLNVLVEESLSAIREVQAFNQEKNRTSLFQKLSQTIVKTSLHHMQARSWLIVSIMLLVFSFISFLLWTGGKDVLQGSISSGDLTSFVFYALLVASSVNALSEIMADVQRSSGAAERLKELLDLPFFPEKDVKNDPPIFTKNLSFQNVCFSYPSRPGQNVLQNINLSIPKGSFVAFVGPSGAGKTTLFQLLLGFYTPEQGEITLDKTSYNALSVKTIRSYFGYVPQDPHMFSGTLKDNLLFGSSDISEDTIQAVLKEAHLSSFVDSLKEGLETRVGEKGIRLSGGQKQRIALARALLKKPQILLLDEPTSALDSKSESFIQQTLEALKQQNTTVLIIAHRLSTIKMVDTIYVFDQGQCIQKGTHDSLLKQKGLYAELSKIQFDSSSSFS